MSVWQILFSFNGRLNRKPYWIATIGLMLVAIMVTGVVGGIVYAAARPATLAEFLRAAHPWFMPFTLLLAYPEAATLAKRLHDRNKPGAIAALFIVPSLISAWLDPQGSLGGLGNGSVHMVHAAASIMTWVVGIWFLVELGFLRGSTGENRYGADPLAAAQVRWRARSPVDVSHPPHCAHHGLHARRFALAVAVARHFYGCSATSAASGQVCSSQCSCLDGAIEPDSCRSANTAGTTSGFPAVLLRSLLCEHPGGQCQ